MKATMECYPCLQRLVHQAVELAACDDITGKAALARALGVLNERFSVQQVSVIAAAAVHRAVRENTDNPDPYYVMKQREIEAARELFPVISRRYGRGLLDCVKLAALGNTVDFFRDFEVIKTDMLRPFEFTINDTEKLARALKKTRYLLFLADNAGEVLFDIPLLKLLRKTARVVYAVKSFPVQDDTTLNEVRLAGLEQEIGEVITTGTATPGIDFSTASAEFRRAYETADVIFAKGMGYYESLTELPASGRVFHCLMVKCEPVAKSLGVPLHSYVMKRR